MDYSGRFPRQTLPRKRKGKEWGKSCVDWAVSRTYFNYAPVRSDIVHAKINYDLVNGKIHMEDIAAVLNPGEISTAFIPDKIQHYPIIVSKLNTLRGEESARAFDWRVVVTNPNAVSQIEEEKKKQLFSSIQQIVENPDIDMDQADQQIQDNQEFYDFNWQDIRELRGNELLKHYSKELGLPRIFNDGFFDAMVCGVEAYQCGIVGGEPVLVRLNPLKLRVLQNGYSNRIEDADVIIYEDYWSRGRIVDTFYDELTTEDIKWLSDEIPDTTGSKLGAAGNYNDANEFLTGAFIGENGVFVKDASEFPGVFDTLTPMVGGIGSDLMPYDIAGNIRVVRVWWTSRRKILQVKSFDPVTGNEVLDFYPETYIPDESIGEKATPMWVNEKWEGTKIGDNIYVGIRPCLVQHNSISNPSRCHAGIVGTIYSTNEMPVYSLVDMMKPYNYLYDAVSAKLVDLIATNWGKLLELDLAAKPKNWEVDKWMYFARANKVLIKDSFNEGDKGAALGKLYAGLNNASKGVVDADWGQSIQNYINILAWVSESMSELVGINRQREGNTYSRETVGGIERAVLQSSYITEWLFLQHEDTKRRALESLLEEAKGAMHGRSKKFSYILSNGSMRIMDIPGDEFCECDYGLVVDNSQDIQKLNSKLEEIAQAATQNGYRVSSLIKLYSSMSIQEKARLIERDEKEMMKSQQQAAQQQQQLEQQKIQAEMEKLRVQMEHQDAINQRDNQTKIDVAEINARAEYLRLGIYEDQNNEEILRENQEIEREKLREEIRQFDKELRFKEKELGVKKDVEMKKISAQKAKNNSPKK